MLARHRTIRCAASEDTLIWGWDPETFALEPCWHCQRLFRVCPLAGHVPEVGALPAGYDLEVQRAKLGRMPKRVNLRERMFA